ncbi:MAG TPA: hypothetical protein VGM24_10160 [Puia sp.]|jgi:hypothetical protein
MENGSSAKRKEDEPGQKEKDQSNKRDSGIKAENGHLGSSNAFEKTENPESADPDGITDEKIEEWLDE